MYIKAGMKEAGQYKVIDVATGKEIQHVIWADDIKGEYEIFFKDKKGKVVMAKDKRTGTTFVFTKHKKGNIKLVKK